MIILMSHLLCKINAVKEGDSVTLHTNLTEIWKDDDIEWRYGEKGNLIAKYVGGQNRIYTYDVDLDGKFKGRLQLDPQTGDLTLRNIRTTDSGPYEVTNRFSLNKMFSLEGVSAEEIQIVSAMVGDSVFLHTDVIEMLNYDVIRWKFGPQNALIAEINKLERSFRTLDGDDGRFRHRLQLDQTGSLIIKNTGIKHSGLYEVDISSGKHTIHKTFNVNISGEIKAVSVKEGVSVTLHTGLTEVQMSDFTLWMFGDTVIAELFKEARRFYTYDGEDVRFKGMLNLDNQTGSLTITNIRILNSGLYDLKISSSRRTINKRISLTVINSFLSSGVVAGIAVVVLLVPAAAAVCVTYYRFRISILQKQLGERKSVLEVEGASVTLKTDVAAIRSHDVVLWQFGNKSVFLAQVTEGNIENTRNEEICERFKDRLELSDQTGDLTITDTRATDSGLYKALIITNRRFSSKSFTVSVSVTSHLTEREAIGIVTVDLASLIRRTTAAAAATPTRAVTTNQITSTSRDAENPNRNYQKQQRSSSSRNQHDQRVWRMKMRMRDSQRSHSPLNTATCMWMLMRMMKGLMESLC
ncbi:uncharacterized protein isoform X4 [Danio rerio]|uniref:Uncharacterized protein isoform X4 n=1 Tax=Danio rerio TaxID=7955 RepID=A0AC58IG06_DANRE